MFEWHNYTGAPLPEGTTHVQLKDGSVIDVRSSGDSGIHDLDTILRYYGPAPAPVANAAEPILPIPRDAWYDTAEWCLEALLNGDLVTITHPEGYERCGLDVPFKRGQPTGGLTHQYRPIVILEWLAGQIPKRY